MLRNEHAVLAVSTLLTGQYGVSDVYLGTSCIVGKTGIERVIELELDDADRKGFQTSAALPKTCASNWLNSRENNLLEWSGAGPWRIRPTVLLPCSLFECRGGGLRRRLCSAYFFAAVALLP